MQFSGQNESIQDLRISLRNHKPWYWLSKTNKLVFSVAFHLNYNVSPFFSFFLSFLFFGRGRLLSLLTGFVGFIYPYSQGLLPRHLDPRLGYDCSTAIKRNLKAINKQSIIGPYALLFVRTRKCFISIAGIISHRYHEIICFCYGGGFIFALGLQCMIFECIDYDHGNIIS